MDYVADHLAYHVAEFVKDKLYFVSMKTNRPRYIPNIHFFSIDDELEYESFYSDFGPLNLAMLYRYCCLLNKKMKKYTSTSSRIVHYTSQGNEKRVNAAFLIGSYAVLHLKKPIDEIYKLLIHKGPLFVPFRDASLAHRSYNLSVFDCIRAVQKAFQLKLLDFESFDVEEYEFYEKVINGDLNWIVPNKFIAFCGPHSNKQENSYHCPEDYFEYFRKCNVTTIIRLNKKIYDAKRFKDNGFDHYDLFFVDGSTPTDTIMENFLQISETAKGVIAVHCKAGLGRTGTLIACYIMKHYNFTAAEAIAWVRICRPGSIIAHQQHWLEEKEALLCYHIKFTRVDIANIKNNNYDENKTKPKPRARKDVKLANVMNRVEQVHLSDKTATAEISTRSRRAKAFQVKPNNPCDQDNNNNNNTETDNITQGDELNRIKAQRRQPRSHTTGALDIDHLKPHQRSSSQPFKLMSPKSSLLHSAYASPQKPHRSTVTVQQGVINSCQTSPVAGNSARHAKRSTPTSSPTRRRTWRHLVVSPQHYHHHQIPKWDLTFLDSALNNNAPSTSASQSVNLNSPPTFMNLRSRAINGNTDGETLRQCSAPPLSPERSSPRQTKQSLPR